MAKTVLDMETAKKPAKLLVFHPDRQPEEIFLGERAVLGRNAGEEGVDIAVVSPIVSRKHGEFVAWQGEYFYRDLDSSNGTYVNGSAYGKKGRRSGLRLQNGDVFRIDQSDKNASHPDAVVMIFLTSYSENVRWVSRPLTEDIAGITSGRGPEETLSLNGPEEMVKLKDQAASPNQALICRTPRGWEATDQDGTKGLYVNSRKVRNPVGLRAGDVVRLVDVCLVYWGDRIIYSQTTPAGGRGAPLAIRIAKRDVRRNFQKATVLRDINLTIQPGELVMVLGGSGVGKTTFMNAVMGYEKAEGHIKHGDIDIYEDYELIKYDIGFVPQQDLLRGSDTVFYTLSNAAEMKMPRRVTSEERYKRVEEVLELFGLRRERDSLVSKLSGGQRKRLSIAVELISDPGLFFLDEPDSGLDGIMAQSLHEKLRLIADSGKIVFVITHSPDRVVQLYDKIIVLAKSARDNCGYLAYYGSPNGARAFFAADSMEGIVQRVNRPDEGGDGKADYYIAKYKELRGGEDGIPKRQNQPN